MQKNLSFSRFLNFQADGIQITSFHDIDRRWPGSFCKGYKSMSRAK
jgi:hypothetical protein